MDHGAASRKRGMFSRELLRRELLDGLLPGQPVPKDIEASSLLEIHPVQAGRQMRRAMAEIGMSYEWTGKRRVVVEAPIPGLFV